MALSPLVLAERDRTPGRAAIAYGVADAIGQRNDALQQAALNAPALPFQDTVNADHAFLTAAITNGRPSSTALQESYYKLLPDLTRGAMVPKGYPTGYDGIVGDNFFPKIVPLSPTGDPSQVLNWSATGVKGVPQPRALTLAQYLSDPATVAVQGGILTPALGWWNPKIGVYASYQPSMLFDQLYQQRKIFADPTAGYFTNQYNQYDQISMLKRLAIDAVVVVSAIFGGEALAGLDGTAAGAGAAGAGAAGGGLTATTVAPVSFSGEIAAPVAEVDTGLTASTIAPISFGAAAGGASLSGIGGSIVSGASKLFGSSAGAQIAQLLGALTGVKTLGAPSAPGPATTSTAPAPQKSLTGLLLGGGAALAILYLAIS